MIANDVSGLLPGCGNEILLLVDPRTQAIRDANEAATRHLGYARDDLIGRPITDIVCASADFFYWEDVRRGIAADIHDIETSYLRADSELLGVSRSIIHPASRDDALVVRAIPTGRPRDGESRPHDTMAYLLAALEVAADGILLLDRHGTILDMNRRFAQIWRIPEETLQSGKHHAVFEFMASSASDPEAYRRRLAEIAPDSGDESRDLLSLGDGRFIQRRSRPAKLGETVIGRVFSFVDISSRRDEEFRSALSASVFSRTQDGIMITNEAGNIVDVNDSFSRITGYAREEVIGRNPRFLKSGSHGEEFYRAMWHELATRGHWEGEIWNRRKNGLPVAERLSISAVRNALDASPHYVAILSDITDLKEYERQIEHMMHYDALTGMPNRLLFSHRLDQALARARRYSRHMALIHLDIDGFKEVNNRHGRETGDQLLIAIARRLRDTLREDDTLARLGGGEFAAIITGLDSRTGCEPLLNQLLEAVVAPVDIQRNTLQISLQISASLGATLFPRDDSNADTLMRHAALAMYQAKETGKNRYRLFDPEEKRQTRIRQKSLERIAQAIARNEFELHFQPKVNMRTGGVVGAEALIRWRDPERGLVPPGDFLPSIDGSDLMTRLGDWVLDAALLQMTGWLERGLDIAVSVNIAACHLQRADFLPNLQKKLSAYPAIRPGRLEIEVLETEALSGIGQITRLMESCQAIGVRFSLDDFGTGYSSLTYLRRLPADALKIDQSFVRDMLSNSGDMAIVEGVIGLAGVFGKTVIAEGVETMEHGQRLLRLGCDLAQGYGIARPMPADDLPAWIAAWRPAFPLR
jgi:diguanylate cyclase (GGDEF)-like protein/PAS domain S-box-containing protein